MRQGRRFGFAGGSDRNGGAGNAEADSGVHDLVVRQGSMEREAGVLERDRADLVGMGSAWPSGRLVACW